jgi:hypothetical protein
LINKCHIEMIYIANVTLQLSRYKCHITNVTLQMSRYKCHVTNVTSQMSRRDVKSCLTNPPQQTVKKLKNAMTY